MGIYQTTGGGDVKHLRRILGEKFKNRIIVSFRKPTHPGKCYKTIFKNFENILGKNKNFVEKKKRR